MLILMKHAQTTYNVALQHVQHTGQRLLKTEFTPSATTQNTQPEQDNNLLTLVFNTKTIMIMIPFSKTMSDAKLQKQSGRGSSFVPLDSLCTSKSTGSN